MKHERLEVFSQIGWFWTLGYRHDMVLDRDYMPYLERWVIALLGFSFRLHKFLQGDDARAPHDHPWFFITCPLSGYREIVSKDGRTSVDCVKSMRLHYRPATHRHIISRLNRFPFYSLVFTGRRKRHWGFWPTPSSFIGWEDFK